MVHCATPTTRQQRAIRSVWRRARPPHSSLFLVVSPGPIKLLIYNVKSSFFLFSIERNCNKDVVVLNGARYAAMAPTFVTSSPRISTSVVSSNRRAPLIYFLSIHFLLLQVYSVTEFEFPPRYGRPSILIRFFKKSAVDKTTHFVDVLSAAICF